MHIHVHEHIHTHTHTYTYTLRIRYTCKLPSLPLPPDGLCSGAAGSLSSRGLCDLHSGVASLCRARCPRNRALARACNTLGERAHTGPRGESTERLTRAMVAKMTAAAMTPSLCSASGMGPGTTNYDVRHSTMARR